MKKFLTCGIFIVGLLFFVNSAFAGFTFDNISLSSNEIVSNLIVGPDVAGGAIPTKNATVNLFQSETLSGAYTPTNAFSKLNNSGQIAYTSFTNVTFNSFFKEKNVTSKDLSMFQPGKSYYVYFEEAASKARTNTVQVSINKATGQVSFTPVSNPPDPNGNTNPPDPKGNNNPPDPKGTDLSGSKVVKLANPLREGLDTIPKIVEAIISGIVIPIGVPIFALYLIYSGILFIIAKGNPEGITKAKNTLKWTLIGGAILLGSYVIANVVQTTISGILK